VTRPADAAGMAGHRALAAVGLSLVDLLDRRFREVLPTGRRPKVVLVGTQDLDRVNTPNAVISFPAVSLYCYRLSVDRETRAGWVGVTTADGIPRLPLRMHFLVSAWDDFAEHELEWLGLAVRVLEGEPILTGPLLHPNGGWERGDAIQVVPDDLALDSMSEAFQALTTAYRLCLPYLARVIKIHSRVGPVDDPTATIGAAITTNGRAQS
jgi:hypothetical protein